jgi:pilus assembly protein CpaE
LNVLTISADAGFIESIRAALNGVAAVTELRSWRGDLAAQSVLPESDAVELVIVDCRIDARDTMQALAGLLPLYPLLQTAICAPANAPEVLLSALRLGVQEVISFPVKREELVGMLARLSQKRQVGARRQGQIFSFLSCKGGSGATFLAANLAYALAADGKTRVLLIDMNLQFGDAVLFVSDQRPTVTLADMTSDVQRIDLALLDSSVVSVLPNFGVLASPSDPTQSTQIKPGQVEALLRFCRAHVDFVVLDLGRSIDAVVVKALDLSDHIYPVLQLSLPFIRDGKRQLDMFRSLDYPVDKLRLLVNRLEKTTSLNVADVERSLNCKVFKTISNDWESASDSVNQGVPIVKLHRNSVISRQLEAFAGEIKGLEVSPSGGWLKRLIQRNSDLG